MRDERRRLDFALEERRLHRILGDDDTSLGVHDDDIDTVTKYSLSMGVKIENLTLRNNLFQLFIERCHAGGGHVASSVERTRRGVEVSDGDTGQQTSVITWAVGDLILHARKGGRRWWDDDDAYSVRAWVAANGENPWGGGRFKGKVPAARAERGRGGCGEGCFIHTYNVRRMFFFGAGRRGRSSATTFIRIHPNRRRRRRRRSDASEPPIDRPSPPPPPLTPTRAIWSPPRVRGTPARREGRPSVLSNGRRR